MLFTTPLNGFRPVLCLVPCLLPFFCFSSRLSSFIYFLSPALCAPTLFFLFVSLHVLSFLVFLSLSPLSLLTPLRLCLTSSLSPFLPSICHYPLFFSISLMSSIFYYPLCFSISLLPSVFHSSIFLYLSASVTPASFCVCLSVCLFASLSVCFVT